MRRNVEVRLAGNTLMEGVLRQWKEILERDPADAEARRHHDEVAREVVPRAARKDLARSFDAKVNFVRDRGDIQETESRVSRSCTGTATSCTTATAYGRRRFGRHACCTST